MKDDWVGETFVCADAGQAEEAAHGRIGRGQFPVYVHDEHSHRGGGDKQFQKMVLLLGPYLIFVELAAHPVEQLYDAVRVCLSYGTEPGGEVLFFQQVNTSRQGVDRPDCFPVEYGQQYYDGYGADLDDKPGPFLLFRCEHEYENGSSDRQCEYRCGYEPEISPCAHHAGVSILYFSRRR